MSGVSLARPWLSLELEREMQDALAFLTSRDVSRFTDQSAKAGRTTVRCIATLGLSNAERVGMRVNRQARDRGTINIAVRLNTGLSRTALIEALSIATQVRRRR
jgi:adenosylcobinamide amidohydrolase